MNAPCPRSAEMRRLVAARLDDTISPAGSRALKEHAPACPACSSEVLAIDPTLLFSSLALEVPSRGDESESRRLLADVLAAIDLEGTRRRIARPPRRLVLRAASVVLLAGTLLALLQATKTPKPLQSEQRPEALAAQQHQQQKTARSAPVLIDHLENPGATVYQFASTSAQEPNIVFVVDRNADI